MINNDNNSLTTIICPLSKRFESIFVCAINCNNRCQIYLDNINLELLEDYIREHPEYEIRGEIMAVKKTIKDTDTKKGKSYWILDEEDRVTEVTEQEIIENPKEYLQKEIWDKPPNQYEIVITLKRKKI